MKESVLITGASTGIGYQIALDLAQFGYQVYAGARKPQDIEKLSQSHNNIKALSLDVTNEDQVQQAFEVVSQSLGDHKLHLINNAGLGYASPVELTDISEVKKLFDVNYFGVLSITKTFLPLIRKTSGRIINMSSVSGKRSFPFLSAYAGSKHALEAMTDSLRWELLGTDCKVVAIEPGPIKTPIWEKGLSTNDSLLSKAQNATYYEKPLQRFAKLIGGVVKQAISTEEVSKVVIDSLQSSNPPPHRLVASKATRVENFLSTSLPSFLVDGMIKKRLFK